MTEPRRDWRRRNLHISKQPSGHYVVIRARRPERLILTPREVTDLAHVLDDVIVDDRLYERLARDDS